MSDFDPKELLRVSCIIWCYFQSDFQPYPTVNLNFPLFAFLLSHSLKLKSKQYSSQSKHFHREKKKPLYNVIKFCDTEVDNGCETIPLAHLQKGPCNDWYF